MTLRELKRILDATKEELLDLEVKVWPPGSRVSLNPLHSETGLLLHGNTLLIEGNIDEGSALFED